MSRGNLKLTSKEIIDSSMVRKIILGPTPHQLIYLERPTFTLVLRSRNIENYSMHEYFFPGLSIKGNFIHYQSYKDIEAISSLPELFNYLEIANEAVVLGIYSGALLAYNSLLIKHYDEMKNFIEKKYSEKFWFHLYLEYLAKHKIYLEKILMR
jgi:hypothetical protein